MPQLGQKKKLKSTPITKKYVILKEIDKGKSLTIVALKHGMSKQTVSNWVKQKLKRFMKLLIRIRQQRRDIDLNSPGSWRSSLAKRFKKYVKRC